VLSWCALALCGRFSGPLRLDAAALSSPPQPPCLGELVPTPLPPEWMLGHHSCRAPTTTAFYISFWSRGRTGWRLWKIGAPVALTPRGTATGEYACACVRACVRFYVKYSYPKHCAYAFLCASMLCMLIAFRWNRCNKESGGANRLRASGILFHCIPQLAQRNKGTVVA